MKPIKPKKMPKALEEDLSWSVKNGVTLRTHPRLARAILAALEYERQRADKAEKEATRLRTVAGVLPTLPHASVKAVAAEGRKAAKRRAKGPWSAHFD